MPRGANRWDETNDVLGEFETREICVANSLHCEEEPMVRWLVVAVVTQPVQNCSLDSTWVSQPRYFTLA